MSDNEMEDLFGSDNDEQPAVEGTAAAEVEVEHPAVQQRAYDEEAELFGSDDEQEPAGPSIERGLPIDVATPMHRRHPPDRVHLMKLTNIVALEQRPWDASQFEGGLEEYKDDRGATRVRLRDANVIRWRIRRAPDGSLVPESNARLVRWSDGSLQLLLGDEPLDVTHTDITRDGQYAFTVNYSAIQGHALLRKRMQFRPSSLKSRLHQRLRAVVGAQHARKEKITTYVSGANPEEEKQRLEQLAEDKEKMRLAQERAENRFRAPQLLRRAPLPRARPSGPRLTPAYLEGDDDDGFIDNGPLAYDDDEGDALAAADDAAERARWRFDEEMEAEGARRLQNAKRALSSPPVSSRKRRVVDEPPSDEDGGGEEGGEEEVEEIADEPAAKAPKPRVKRGVLLDSDDDD